MAQYQWLNPVNGDFNTAGDWGPNGVPQNTDDAILNAAGADYTVSVYTDETVNSIQLAANASLDITGGRTASNFTAFAGTGSGGNAGTIYIGDGSTFSVAGTLNNSGAILVAGITRGTSLTLNGSTTLSGGGQVTLSSAPSAILGTGLLTNLDNTISGAGDIGQPGGLALANGVAGVINATGFNALQLAYCSTVNSGLIEGTGVGGLSIQYSRVDGSTGGTINASDGSKVELLSADIVGGTLATSGSGLIETVDSGSTLDGLNSLLNNTGQFTVNDGNLLTVKGALQNSGIIGIHSAGVTTTLFLGDSTALSGGGQLTLSDNVNNVISGVGSVPIFLNDDNTISGAGDIGNGGFLTFFNDVRGVVDATGVNALSIDTGAQRDSNAGLLEATGAGGLTIFRSTIDGSSGGTIFAGDGSIVNFLGATILGGTLTTSGSGVILVTDSSSQISSVTNTGQLTVTEGHTLTIEGAITNGGTISSGANYSTTGLQVVSYADLSGGGQIMLSDNANNVIDGASVTLTNEDNTIAGAGDIGKAGTLTLVNGSRGVIDATGFNVLILQAKSIANQGLIEALGSGGLLIENTSVDGSGGGVVAANAGSVAKLMSADIIGGTLTTSGSGVIEVIDSGSTFDGRVSSVSNTGQLTIDDGKFLTLEGAIHNTGTLTVNSKGTKTSIVFGGDTTLSGGGRINLSDNANNIIGGGVTKVLTNDDNTISGAGNIGAGGTLKLVNGLRGVIDATGTNALYLDTGSLNVTNDGLIEATGPGGLVIGSYMTIDNSGGGRIFAGAASAVNLLNIHIIGGTLTSTGSGRIRVKSGASILDGSQSMVNNNAVVEIYKGATLGLMGTIANAGTLSVNGANPGAQLLIDSNTTLTGGGRINIGNASVVKEGAAGVTLYNSDNKIVGSGTLGLGGLALANGKLGVIDAHGGNMNIVAAGAIINAGLIRATGGGLGEIFGAVSNTGFLEAAGGSLDVLGAVTGTGGFGIVSNGTLSFRSSFSQNVKFAAHGVLRLYNSMSYGGRVLGFNTTDSFDLRDIKFVGVGEATYIDNGKHTGGVLTVNDGMGDVANIKFVGNFFGATFTAQSDMTGGVIVTEGTGPNTATPVSTGTAEHHRFVAAVAGWGVKTGGGNNRAAMPPQNAMMHLFAPRVLAV